MADFDKRIFGVPDDTKVLPWYDGAFSKAFVALHPFFLIDGLDPAVCEHGTLVLFGRDRPEDVDLVDWCGQAQADRLIGKELTSSSVDDASKRFGKNARWSTIGEQVGLADHRDINRALRTHIGGLKAEYADPASAERLISHCARMQTFLPTEGQLQPTMEDSFVNLFRRAGLTHVVIGDEFGDEEYVVSVDELCSPNSWPSSRSLPLPYPRRIFAQDRSLLVTVHWDSFFTFILGTDDRLQDVEVGSLFEGFWCSETTTISWQTEPLIPLVE